MYRDDARSAGLWRVRRFPEPTKVGAASHFSNSPLILKHLAVGIARCVATAIDKFSGEETSLDDLLGHGSITTTAAYYVCGGERSQREVGW